MDREYGYKDKDGSAITQILKRLQQDAGSKPAIAERMSRLENEFNRRLSAFKELSPFPTFPTAIPRFVDVQAAHPPRTFKMGLTMDLYKELLNALNSEWRGLEMMRVMKEAATAGIGPARRFRR